MLAIPKPAVSSKRRWSWSNRSVRKRSSTSRPQVSPLSCGWEPASRPRLANNSPLPSICRRPIGSIRLPNRQSSDSAMHSLVLHEIHVGLNARFTEVNGMEVVEHYGDPLAEHAALRNAVVVLDMSFRSRLCLVGADRQKFLNGQVTNNVKDLKVGEGCYAALVNAKGKMQSDLNIYLLQNEILLDFEPGLSASVAQRLEKYIIADDVQVVEVAPHYGLLSVQGPKSPEALKALEFDFAEAQPSPGPLREANGQTTDLARPLFLGGIG